MQLRFTRAWLVAATMATALVPSALLVAPPARAEAPALDATRARELFREALTLEAAGDYATALSKLQQVARFKTTPQVSFNLGVCYEKLGRLVVALGHYRIALADAEQDPALKKVADEASRAITELEPKIPSLTVNRGSNAENATIKLDGKEVASAAIGTAMLLDPGSHTLEASAPGFDAFKKQFKLTSGEKASLEIALTASPAGASPAPAPSAPAPAQTPGAVPTQAPGPAPLPGAEGGSTLRTAGWIALGVGVAGGITSAVFFARRSAAISDLDAACGPDKQSCPSSAHATIDDGKTATLIGNVGMAVGVVGILGGIVMIASGGGKADAAPPASSASRFKLVPSSAGSLVGASINARF